jgi:hypothetical protein
MRRPLGPQRETVNFVPFNDPNEFLTQFQSGLDNDQILLGIPQQGDPEPITSKLYEPSSAILDAMRGMTQARLQGAGELQRMAEENARKLSEQALFKMAPRAMMQIMSGRKIDTTRARKVQELALAQAMRVQEIAERRKLLEAELPAQEAVERARYMDEINRANLGIENNDLYRNEARRDQVRHQNLAAAQNAGPQALGLAQAAYGNSVNERNYLEQVRQSDRAHNENVRQFNERMQVEQEARLLKLAGGDRKFFDSLGVTMAVLTEGVASKGRFDNSARFAGRWRSRNLMAELQEHGRGLDRFANELQREWNDYLGRLAQQGLRPDDRTTHQVRRLQGILDEASKALEETSGVGVARVWANVERQLQEIENFGGSQPSAQGGGQQQQGSTAELPFEEAMSIAGARLGSSGLPAAQGQQPAQEARVPERAALTTGATQQYTTQDLLNRPQEVMTAARQNPSQPIVVNGVALESAEDINRAIQEAPQRVGQMVNRHRTVITNSVRNLREIGLTDLSAIGPDTFAETYANRHKTRTSDADGKLRDTLSEDITVNGRRFTITGATEAELDRKIMSIGQSVEALRIAAEQGGSFTRDGGNDAWPVGERPEFMVGMNRRAISTNLAAAAYRPSLYYRPPTQLLELERTANERVQPRQGQSDPWMR